MKNTVLLHENLKATYDAEIKQMMEESFHDSLSVITPTYEQWLEDQIERLLDQRAAIKAVVGHTAVLSNPHKYIEANAMLYKMLFGEQPTEGK